MKVSQEQYEHIRDAVSGVVSKNGPEKIAAFRATQTTERQFRWNLLWAAGISAWIASELQDHGVKDDHIDTALRKVMKELAL